MYIKLEKGAYRNITSFQNVNETYLLQEIVLIRRSRSLRSVVWFVVSGGGGERECIKSTIKQPQLRLPLFNNNFSERSRSVCFTPYRFASIQFRQRGRRIKPIFTPYLL